MRREMRLCLPPFEGYKSSGPYFHEKNGRWHLNLLTLNGTSKHLNMAYARYLIAIQSNRVPDKDEEVDHIDGDRTHDLLKNLRIIPKKDNTEKAKTDPRANPRKETFKYTCNKCGVTFFCNRTKAAHLKGNKVSYCSRACIKGPKVLLFEGLRFVPLEKPRILVKNLKEDWHSFSREVTQSDIQVSSQVKLSKIGNTSKIIRGVKSVIKYCSFCNTPFYPKNKTQRTCSRACSDIFFKRIKVIPEQVLLKVKQRIERQESTWVLEAKSLGISDNGLRKKLKKLELYPRGILPSRPTS